MARKPAKKKQIVPALAEPGDPIVWIDGRQYLPEHCEGRVEKKVTKDNFKPTRRRSSKEMPAVPAVMNGVGAVMIYTILGLSDREMAACLKVDVVAVTEIKKHPAYQETFDIVASEFVNAKASLLSARIAAAGDQALDRVIHYAFNATQEAVGLRASQDLLDRGGHSIKQMEGRSATMKNELRITITEGEKEVHIEQVMENGETDG